jgi:hypothetical protein
MTEETLFTLYKDFELNEDYDEDEEDVDGYYWPQLPEKLKFEVEKIYKEKFHQAPNQHKITEFMKELGFDNIQHYISIFDEERKLNGEKKLTFDWTTFKGKIKIKLKNRFLWNNLY